MNRRPMGVPVNQGLHAKRLHDPRNLLRRDIDNVVGLHPRLRPAFASQFARQFVACAQRQMAQDEPGDRITQVAAQLHVADVAGAKTVAVHQQHRLTVKLHDARVLQQRAAGLFTEGLAEQEVAIAVHQKNGRAAVAQLAQGLADGTLEGRHGIVANPRLEEVAQNVQRTRRAGASGEQTQKRPGNVRALLFQMQV